MGIFGSKPLPYGMSDPYRTPGIGDGIPGNQQIGGGVNLPQGNAGMVDTSVAPDPYQGQRPQGGGGLFGKLGIHNVGDGLGLLADAFMFGPAVGVYRNARKRNQQKEDINNAYKQAMAEKAARETNTDTQAMRNFAAAGYQPGTPEYFKAMRDYIKKPNVVMMGGQPYDQQALLDNQGGGGGIPDGYHQDAQGNWFYDDGSQ